MPMKGSLRGKGGITGWWGSSPSKHESPNSPRDYHDQGSTISSMQPILSQDENYIDSPSSGKKSGWFDTINNTIKGKSKKSRKSIKDREQDERHDSSTHSIPYNSGEAEVRHSSPIPFKPLPEIQPGDPIKSNKALETVIAGPDGYAPSIESTKEMEQASSELATRCLAPADHGPPPTACCISKRRPPIKNLTSFVMDDVFEDASQIAGGEDISLDNPPETPLTGPNISNVAVLTENLAHFKSSSTGHVDHITGEWRSNDPAGSAIIGRSGRTVSGELRYQKDIMRQCAGTWLEAQSMLTQIYMAMGDEVARIDPRLAPGTTMADILAWPDPSAFFSEHVESERLERRRQRQRQELESEIPRTPWLKISEDEAISIANNVLSSKDFIEKNGVGEFVKAMRDPNGQHDLQVGHYQRPCTADEAHVVLESFKDEIRLKKRCQSLASIAVIEDWMLQFPPDDTAGVVLEDWLFACQISLGDDDDDDEDTFVKTHPNRRRGRADEVKRKRNLEKKTTKSNKRMCMRTFDKNTVERRVLRCWLGLSENEPIPAVKTHPRRTRQSWVKRMKTQPLLKETGYLLEKSMRLASRGKSMGFLVLPFRTRPLPSSSEESQPMTLPASSDAAKAASDDSHTMILPALSDNAKAEGLEWDVLMDGTPRFEKISPFEKELLVEAEKTYLAPEIVTVEEVDAVRIGLSGNWEESSDTKGMSAAEKVLIDETLKFEKIWASEKDRLVSAEKLVVKPKKATAEEVDVAEIGLLGNWEDSAAAKGIFAAEKMLIDATERGAALVGALKTGPGIVKERSNLEEMMWSTLDQADAAAEALEFARNGLFDAMEKGSAAGSGLSFVEERMQARLEVAELIIKRLRAGVDQRVEDARDEFIIEGYVMPVAGEAMAKAYEERLLATIKGAATDIKKASLAILQKAEEKRRVHQECALADEGYMKVHEESLSDQEESLEVQEDFLKVKEDSVCDSGISVYSY
ncbi:hypothetical protein EG328_001271 [Venturia inaequalis]|uniref:Uncharacterized protein n=1 Tax=Venturia inaequalis TaxID=5025 RepID=A0A8H3VFK4_VENIN|nr:hypothetical protein EG328_001271 [Venturia inaequalis]